MESIDTDRNYFTKYTGNAIVLSCFLPVAFVSSLSEFPENRIS